MNDEKEVERIAHDALSGSLSEGKLIEQIVAHGKSCYERGREDRKIVVDGSAKDIIRLAEENDRLKERVAEWKEKALKQPYDLYIEMEKKLQALEAQLKMKQDDWLMVCKEVDTLEARNKELEDKLENPCRDCAKLANLEVVKEELESRKVPSVEELTKFIGLWINERESGERSAWTYAQLATALIAFLDGKERK